MRVPDHHLLYEFNDHYTYRLVPARGARVSGLVTAQVIAADPRKRRSHEVPGTVYLRAELSPREYVDAGGGWMPCPEPLTFYGREVLHLFAYVRLIDFPHNRPAITALGTTGYPSADFPAAISPPQPRTPSGRFWKPSRPS